VSPTAAPAGVTVTVSGLDFEAQGSLEALFFGAVEAVIDEATPASIVCRVPRGLAAGATSISLATRVATAATTLSFTVQAGIGVAPTVSTIAPVAGPVGAQVTITGTGFGPTPTANEVTLAGLACAIVSGAPTQLVVTVPAGAKAGALVVTTPGGASSLARTFFVTTAAPPVSLGAPGDRNRDYVTASPMTHLLVEVDVEGGAPSPQQAALDDLRAELAARLQKPGGVLVLRDPAFAATGTTTWTTPALVANDLAVRGHYDGPNCAVLHYSFVDGVFEQSDVIGLAYTGSSLTVFETRLAGNLGPFGRAVVEAAVAIHEAGHLLGLVDIGTPMVNAHEDAAGGHDASDDCVMFAAITTDRVGIRTNPPPRAFDAECVRDLRALGGK